MTAAYTEPARSYRSLVATMAVLAAGVGVDAAITGHGAVTHLPGWLVFGGLLLAIQWVALYAVRSTHSLALTPDTLSVGDESIERADIVAASPGAAEDARTLGWPDGFPRRAQPVTLSLAGGERLLVATRHPERLLAELGVAVPELTEERPIRPVTDAERPVLEEIDKRAEALFRVAGYELPDDPAGGAHGRELVVLVAGDPPVGFVAVEEVDGEAYVAELSVLPAAMRQGLGTRLLDEACTRARAAGFAAITLTTFADVSWNGPFYAARGFREWPTPGPGLQAIRAHEAEIGLDAVAPRIVMRRELSPGTSAG